ncbi:MAG: WD40 repeat domain-containing protein [Solirubrobacteraceae bacterium]|nr:WD40 repeat domain-containing protein [Solirubrobacteraceae bacterium]
MARPSASALIDGGFLLACDRAVAEGDLETLQDHAYGSSAEIEAIELRVPESARRAQAIAAVALACAVDASDRADHLAAAIETWSERQVHKADALIELGTISAPEDAEAKLARVCERWPTARLAPLADAAARFTNRTADPRQSAVMLFPTTNASQTAGQLLRVKVSERDGLAPGIHEDLDGVLAPRDQDWRAMETAVDAYLSSREGGSRAPLRYALQDLKHVDKKGETPHFTDSLSGNSAGLALAIAARAATRQPGRAERVKLVLRRRHRLDGNPLDRGVGATAAIDSDGNTRAVGGLLGKLTPQPERQLSPDERSELRRQYFAQMRMLLLAGDQEQDIDGLRDDVPLTQVKSVDAALAAALRRDPWPVKTIGAFVVAVLAAVFVTWQQVRPDPLPAAQRALPGRIDAAEARLKNTDPDLASLLRVEEQVVMPSDNAMSKFLSVYKGANERSTTIRPGWPPSELGFDGAGRLLVGGPGTIESFLATDGRQADEQEVFRPFERVRGIGLSEGGGKWLATSDYRSLEIRRLGSSAVVTFKTAGINDAEFTADERHIVVGGKGRAGVIAGPEFRRIRWHDLDSDDDALVLPKPDSEEPLLLLTDGRREYRLVTANLATGKTTPVRRTGGAQVRRSVTSDGAGRYVGITQDERGVEVARIKGTRWTSVRTVPLDWKVRLVARIDGTDAVLVAGDTDAAIVSARTEVSGATVIPRGWRALAVDRALDRLAVADERQVQVMPLDGRTPGSVIYSGATGGRRIAWAAQRNRLVVGAERKLGLVDLDDPDRDRVIELPFGFAIRAVTVDPRGTVAWVAGAAGRVARVDLENTDTTPTESQTFPDQINALALSPDGRTLAVGAFSETGVVTLDAETLRWNEDLKDLDVSALTWLSDSRLLVATSIVGGSPATLRTLGRDLRPLGKTVAFRDAGFLDLARRPGSSTVAGVGAELALLDISGATPRVIAEPTKLRHASQAVEWTPDGRHLVVADPRSTRVYTSDRSLDLLGELAGGGAVDVAARGGRMATLPGDDGTVRVRGLGVEAWSQEICDRLRRTLKPAEWYSVVKDSLPRYRSACRGPSS